MTKHFKLRVLRYKNGVKVLQYRETECHYANVSVGTGIAYKEATTHDTGWVNVPIVDADEPEESNI